MADISIALSDVQDTRTVNIKGVGVLTIRKLGSGEDLDLSFKRRRMNKIIDELNDISSKMAKVNVKKPAELKTLNTLTAKANALSEEMEEIKKFEFNIYKRLLSDNKDGAVVDLIMSTLSDRERAKIFDIAFGKTTVDAPDTAEAKEVEKNA